MRLRLLQLSIASLLALGAASDALAQSKPDPGDSAGNTAVLPIIYSDSGNKVGAYLLLEPTEQSRVGARWRFGGKNELDARSEEHTSELQSPLRTTNAVFCLTKKKHVNHLSAHI